MATVSQLCEAIAQSANMPHDEVRKFARALINAGDLPKASGRAVPETTMVHRAKLLLAIAASERPSDCAGVMRERFEGKEINKKTVLKAGEFLALAMREIASGDSQFWRKWLFVGIAVRRGGAPIITVVLKEPTGPTHGLKEAGRYEFLGGAYLSCDEEEKRRIDTDYQVGGFPVSVEIPHSVLVAVAFGSVDAAKTAQWKQIESLHGVNSGE